MPLSAKLAIAGFGWVTFSAIGGYFYSLAVLEVPPEVRIAFVGASVVFVATVCGAGAACVATLTGGSDSALAAECERLRAELERAKKPGARA